MTQFKRSKQSRARGSWTHGWGAKKKHRGAGHRGGRGNAGSGKKGDAKKPSYWKDKRNIQPKGFSSKSRVRIMTVNVGDLSKNVEYFVAQEMAKKSGDMYVINLMELGCDKILGSGRVDVKLDVTIEMITKRARAKIEKAGGKITLFTPVAEPTVEPQVDVVDTAEDE